MNDFLLGQQNDDDGVVDWKYDMRRDCQIIVPNLYLGPYSCARDRELLRSLGISHLLAIYDGDEARFMKIHPDLEYQPIYQARLQQTVQQYPIPVPFPIAPHDPSQPPPPAVHRQNAKRRQLPEDDEFADHYGNHQNGAYGMGPPQSNDVDME
ncbi:UNVERIFIED_CONTAM: hypothetical protein HDU68_006837 [Siphonaria sp. JEL0065]|nr:hypothetical protein HDU68_006837 [Siphonaria sp. JEL0065]